MNVLKESPELQELLEAMDTVIGETPSSPQAPEQATPTDNELQPILDRIARREKQRKYAVNSVPMVQLFAAVDKQFRRAKLPPALANALREGAKMVVVTDAADKVLTVENPDKLAGQEGQHVQVSGRVSGDSIHVDTVKKL